MGVDPPAHPRPSRRALGVVLVTLKGATLLALLTLVVAGGLRAIPPSARPGLGDETDAYRRVTQRAVVHHDCSYGGSGSGDRLAPASALIRTTHGHLRRVSFAVGWDVYNGRRPGTLIAVCLDDSGTGELLEVHGSARPWPHHAG